MKSLGDVSCRCGVLSTVLVFFLSAALISAGAYADMALVENGEPAAVIVLPEGPEEGEQQAADELVEHIKRITGTELNVLSEGDDADGLLPILIGRAADEDLVEKVRTEQKELRDWDHLGDDRDTYAFALQVDVEAVQLRGGFGDGGTRTAAYELLEQLGVRWFMPGEIGRVVPETDMLTLARQKTIQVPSFIARDQRGGPVTDAWKMRNREGNALDRSRPGRHGTGGSPGRSEHPEYRAMDEEGNRGGNQLCLTGSHDEPEDPSDPEQNYVLSSVKDHYLDRLRDKNEEELEERIVFDVGPHDGGGFCLCDMCTELDPDTTTPFYTPQQSYTDRYVWFYNQVSTQIDKEFPNTDVLFGFYAYAGLMHPPQDIEPMGNMAISVAPIHLCRIHGPRNPTCPESGYYEYKLETWEPYVEEMWCRGYTWNLACTQLPFPLVHRLREEIPLNYEYGMTGYGTDANHSWATHVPANYIQSKLMWDHEADVDALVQDFYEKFYGPASGYMSDYHELLEAAIRDADHHTGSMWDFPNIYPEQVRAEAHGLISSAEETAAGSENEKYAMRIEILRKNLDRLNAFCAIMEHRHKFEFEAEYEVLQKLWELTESLLEDYEYEMLHARHARRMIKRFIEPITEENYETMAGGAEKIVGFDHEWKFLQDPERWGQYIGLHRPESEGGNWQRIRTDKSWSNQGLRYYFGQSWYRQSVEVPEGYEDRTVKIWFSGVDNTAEVWVNGEWVGANHGGAEFDIDAYGSAFRPFEFDVSDAIRHGGPNVVTVRSYRPGTNELGTGGLVGPAMFYVPAEKQ